MSRRTVAKWQPIIGFRHIAGIEPWEPWAKARFIARQIEEENLTFEETARIVGERETEVRSQYRNYRIATDAEEKLKIPADQVKAKFGFFYASDELRRAPAAHRRACAERGREEQSRPQALKERRSC